MNGRVHILRADPVSREDAPDLRETLGQHLPELSCRRPG